MKQILQNLRTGATEIVDVPSPASVPGHVLIRSQFSLISLGTEKMLVDFARAGWFEKARQQPEKVRMVMDKIRTDGVAPTLAAVFNKLEQPIALGYCNVGVVLEVGAGVNAFAPGDRVVSNGKHAEIVRVPANLCTKVPAAVATESAAFTVLGAIGLQGVRLVQPTLGETVVVTGLGLVGLLTVQLLRAHGCRVLGIDFDAHKLALAKSFGAEVVDLAAGQDPVATARTFSRGRGVDAVIITASTTSNEPVHQAAVMCRQRGRIVLVGVTGLELSRADFYEKELSFQVSCSYGPGRYHSNYEEKGLDYPIGFVRWTEQRNFEAVLDMMAEAKLDVSPLISHRFPVEHADQAYSVVAERKDALGILLEYPTPESASDGELRKATIELPRSETPRAGALAAALIGSGNYGASVLAPAFKAAGVALDTVVSSAGVSSLHAARKHGFRKASTSVEAAIEGTADIMVIATRHDSHARLVQQALAANKHVFVEKPLALTIAELEQVAAAYTGERLLMVGFNRRFAPHVQRMKQLLASVSEPVAIAMTINAGAIDAGHWTQDPLVGGGRILGEGCHFIDLARFLAGSPIAGFDATALSLTSSAPPDSVAITLRFANGSIATINYLANGHKAVPKERVEVFAGGRILQLNNYRTLTGFGWRGFTRMKGWRQDKGQKACVAAFVNAVKVGGPAPIAFDELIETSRVTIEIAESLH
jgi:predicted dehydrogenase/threonine dehydrogenase-like Zn-dependent dehydrogenase